MEAFVILGIPGWSQVLLVLVLIVLLFGGKKIPELMRGIGLGMKEFKDATKEDGEEEKDDKKKLDKSEA